MGGEGAVWVERGRVDERIGFGLYQSGGDRGSIGHVSDCCHLCSAFT